MPEQPETRFVRTIVQELRQIPGVWVEKIQQETIVGTPDLLGCVRGAFFAIEAKVDARSRVHPMQLINLEQIRKAGGYGAIWHKGNWKAELRDFKRWATRCSEKRKLRRS